MNKLLDVAYPAFVFAAGLMAGAFWAPMLSGLFCK